jgi:hypothetical protein
MFCPSPAKVTDEPYRQGNSEALEDYKALAVNLIQKALIGEEINRCWDCNEWVGRCLKGKLNQIARSEACDLFLSKLG